MDPRLRMTVEIETLHELLPELDYYRLLQVPTTCDQARIDAAYRKESRRLHPDRYAALGDEAVVEKVNDIYRRLNEAYRSLKDPELRARYDEELDSGGTRVSDTAREKAARDRATAAGPDQAATNPKAEKYWLMALRDFDQKNYRGAVMNIQFALTFEPENATFKEWLTRSQELAESKKDSFNPYKLRIV